MIRKLVFFILLVFLPMRAGAYAKGQFFEDTPTEQQMLLLSVPHWAATDALVSCLVLYNEHNGVVGDLIPVPEKNFVLDVRSVMVNDQSARMQCASPLWNRWLFFGQEPL